MLGPGYQRLSARDQAFLEVDTPSAFTHGAATLVFRAGPLLRDDGGIDVAPLRSLLVSRLHEIPRFRQKLAWVPLERQPVWIDDPAFDLDYHVRHTRLPFPGGEAELKRLVARLLGNRLDRSRPLWELWVIEGLEGERFALFQKLHHCMIDEALGVDPMQLLLSTQREHEVLPAPHHVPRPAPSGARLLWDASWRYAALPGRIARGAGDLLLRPDARGALRERTREWLGWLRTWRAGALPETPLNARIGPHRRVDWWSVPLADAKAVQRALGVTLHDVVLATVAGAVRSFMLLRSVDPARLPFRAAVPVSVRSGREHGTFGNRVAQWIVDLPIGEPDALARLDSIRAQTETLRASRPAVSADAQAGVTEWVGTRLLAQAAQLAVRSAPFNLMIASVPGPQVPLYLCGAELLETYGCVPLLETTALGVAVLSYSGRLAFGMNADWEAVPDLAAFVAATAASFRGLQDAARGR